MDITDTRDHISYLSNFTADEEKLSSLLHRVKTKDNPNERLLKGLKKIVNVTPEIEEYCKGLDFNTVTKPKHGGRGKDAKPRAPHKSKQNNREWKKRELEKNWDHKGTPDSSWVTPWNM